MNIEPGSVSLPWTDLVFNPDPLPILERIRGLGDPVYNTAENVWLILSYDECAAVLSDPSRFSSAALVDILRDQFGGVTMEGIDGREQHSQVRGIWSREFLRPALENRRELVARIVASEVGGMIERLRAGEVVDAVSTATRRIPMLVIAHMLGLDPSAHADFSSWTDAQIAMLSGAMDPSDEGRVLVEAGKAATRNMNQCVATEIGSRRQPGPDLIGMGACRSDISREDLIANITQLVVAGNETTARLMAASLVVLAGHPEQRSRLAAQPGLLRPAVEELLRYQTIAQMVSRTAAVDVTVAGVSIPEGVVIGCLLGAANRDPRRWDRPDEFDIERKPRANLGFGSGMHTCLGLNLTRLEMEVFLDYLLRELPEWEIPEPPTYGRSFPLSGPEQVMVSAA